MLIGSAVWLDGRQTATESLPTSSIAIGFEIARGGQRAKACGASSCESGEFMNEVGLIYIVLLRSHVCPFAGWLFAGGFQRGLEASDPR